MMNAKQWEKKKEALQEKLSEVVAELEEIRDERQGWFDDRSETWQEGERGQAMEEFIDALDETIDAVGDIEFPEWPV